MLHCICTLKNPWRGQARWKNDRFRILVILQPHAAKATPGLRCPRKESGERKEQLSMDHSTGWREQEEGSQKVMKEGLVKVWKTLESRILQPSQERGKPGGTGSDNLGWQLRTQTHLQSWVKCSSFLLLPLTVSVPVLW